MTDGIVLSPFKIGAVEFKNRILMASMCLNYCDQEGFFTDRYRAFIQARLAGGVGGIIIPGSPYGIISSARPTLSDDRYIPGWKELAELVHEYGAKLICQIHPVPFAPPRVADIHNASDYPKAFIDEMVEAFARTALRCKAAGVDGVEIHGAHAHEIAIFTSPITNRRTDEYGGDTAGRAKFGCDIIRAIKTACGEDYPLIYRMISDDMLPDGLKVEEAARMAQLFEAAGADALNVSVGIYLSEEYVSAPMDFEDCFLADNAAKIKASVRIPIIAVDRVVDISEADQLIREGKADMVAMARALLADPELVNKYAGENDLPVCRCVGCNQGCRDTDRYPYPCCLQNPLMGREFKFRTPLARVERKRPKVLIAGAGPGGLETAVVLAWHGLVPLVCERSDSIGGLAKLAAVAPHKQSMCDVTEYRRKLLDRFGVRIRYNTTVDRELIRKEQPDILIVATGSVPFVPPIPGLDTTCVVTGDDVLIRGGIEGNRVAVIGGGLVGCEAAEFLREQGKAVEVFEMQSRVASEMYHWRQKILVERLCRLGIALHTQTRVLRVDLPRIIVDEGGEQKTYDGFDAVVVAAGRTSVRSLADEAAGLVKKVYVIGDAKAPEFVLGAVRDGFDAAMEILRGGMR